MESHRAAADAKPYKLSIVRLKHAEIHQDNATLTQILQHCQKEIKLGVVKNAAVDKIGLKQKLTDDAVNTKSVADDEKEKHGIHVHLHQHTHYHQHSHLHSHDASFPTTTRFKPPSTATDGKTVRTKADALRSCSDAVALPAFPTLAAKSRIPTDNSEKAFYKSPEKVQVRRRKVKSEQVAPLDLTKASGALNSPDLTARAPGETTWVCR